MQQPDPPYPKFPDQDENGVDLSLIRSNLRLTPTQRVRKGDYFLRSMEAMRKKLPKRSQEIFERLKAQW